MIVIGIDVGLTGALAKIDHNGLQACHDMPTMIRGSGSGAVKNQIDPGALAKLFREMMNCVEIITDERTMFSRPLVDSVVDPEENNDIQEISTRFLLRKEWLNLHLDFSIADALSKLTAATPGTTTSAT